MNINSAFEMFPARNIQVWLALISQSCVSLSTLTRLIFAEIFWENGINE